MERYGEVCGCNEALIQAIVAIIDVLFASSPIIPFACLQKKVASIPL